jgi:hypothetical protein
VKRWLCGLALLMSLPLQADIFRCQINGSTVFSDQPCADDARKIEVEVYQPDAAAVSEQQAITETFKEESRINRIHQLKQKNESLSRQISRLQESRDAELATLRERTYDYGNGYVATHERGLFQKMDQLDNEYDKQIEQLRLQIQHNTTQLDALYPQ